MEQIATDVDKTRICDVVSATPVQTKKQDGNTPNSNSLTNRLYNALDQAITSDSPNDLTGMMEEVEKQFEKIRYFNNGLTFKYGGMPANEKNMPYLTYAFLVGAARGFIHQYENKKPECVKPDGDVLTPGKGKKEGTLVLKFPLVKSLGYALGYSKDMSSIESGYQALQRSSIKPT